MSKNFPQDTVEWRNTVTNNMKESLSMNSETVTNQGQKLAVIWAAWGITTWQEAAGFLAFILSFLALCEWLWKKAIRPLLIRFGYMAPVKHVVYKEIEE